MGTTMKITGTIINGQPILDAPISKHEGECFTGTIDLDEGKSAKMRNYYWGACIPAIAKHLGMSSWDLLHFNLKQEIWPKFRKVIYLPGPFMINGVLYRRLVMSDKPSGEFSLPSYSELKHADQKKFLDLLSEFLQSEFGFDLPPVENYLTDKSGNK